MTQLYLKEISSGEELELFNEEETIIGRTQGDHTFPSDKKLSRQHLKITIKDETPSLIDLGSTNGVLLNGKLLNKNQAYEIKIKDIITFGSMEFVLEKVDEKTLKEKTRLDITASPPPTEALELPGQNYYYFKNNPDSSLVMFFVLWFMINLGVVIGLQIAGVGQTISNQSVNFTSIVMLFMFILKFIQNSSFHNTPLISNLKISFLIGNTIAFILINIALILAKAFIVSLFITETTPPEDLQHLNIIVWLLSIAVFVLLSWFIFMLDIGLFRYFLLTLDHPNFKVTMNAKHRDHQSALKPEFYKMILTLGYNAPRFFYFYDQYMLKSFKVNGMNLFTKNNIKNYKKTIGPIVTKFIILLLAFASLIFIQEILFALLLLPVFLYFLYTWSYQIITFRLQKIKAQNITIDFKLDQKSYRKIFSFLVIGMIASLGSWGVFGLNVLLFYLLLNSIKVSTDYDLSKDYFEDEEEAKETIQDPYKTS
ncbi:FHA domain-containing protein, partial [Bacteriovoracaceae bacterium]|nr:FHA domain-containing protein [Bacteriovoracaceae bacterium]